MRISYGPLSLGIGMFLTKLASLMLVPGLLALFFEQSGQGGFFQSAAVTYCAGFILLLWGRRWPHEQFRLGVRDMFLLTTGVWLAVSAFAALPLMLIEHISYADAFFETMSGLTTTGSTILSGLDTQPHSVLLWRSLLHWIGGIGFIVMGVAVLPLLNVGGMRLFQTESSEWSDKSVPKTRNLAKQLLLLYIALTLACMLAYRLCGMSWFEAVNHAMSTLSTGGFSTSDNSMANFSHSAHWVATGFMLLGSLPFLLIVQAILRRQPERLLQDQQIHGLIKLLLTAASLVALWLWLKQGISPLDALRIAAFNVMSVVSTTGFGLDDFTTWGVVPMVVMVLLMFSGGCSGSTAGGIKTFRFQIGFTLLRKQLMLQIHPSSVVSQHYNGRQVNEHVIRSLVTFMMTYFLTIGGLWLILALCGLDFLTSLGCAMTSVGNVGPGITEATGPAGNFAHLPEMAKWAMSIGMLMGRLEIMTVLVLLFPRFWRD